MDQNQVNELLRNHKLAVGRCGHLAAELASLEREIERETRTMVEDVASVGAQNLTGMPKGNAVGNPTERIGIKLADGWKSERLLDLEEKWLKVKAEYEKIQTAVSYVNAWLNGLTDRERWIVEKQVIDAEYWKVILIRYREEFEEFTSKDTLKRLKARAMEKIYEMAE